MEKYKNLKKYVRNGQHEKWTIENIKDGFSYFFEINGKYPTTKEIDSFDYLPSARTFQRAFGGTVKLREILNLDIPLDQRKGTIRSDMAQKTFKRAQGYEKEFYFYLISKIPEVRVHEHKIIRPGDTAADFFIYTSDNEGVVIDLFYAADIHSLIGIINIKFKKYINVKSPVYFVLIGNEQITQEIIDQKVNNRKNKLSDHIKVVTEDTFKKHLDSLLK